MPAEKISFNQQIVDIKQDEQGVTIVTSNKEVFQGDILVGADGVRSTVRQLLYNQMLDKGMALPVSDTNGKLRVEYICIVGVTEPLDPEKFPELKDNRCHYVDIIGDNKTHCVSFIIYGMEVLYICFGSGKLPSLWMTLMEPLVCTFSDNKYPKKKKKKKKVGLHNVAEQSYRVHDL